MANKQACFDVYRTVFEEQKSISPTRVNHPCLLNVGFLVAFLMAIPDYTSEAVWVLPEPL